MKALPRSLLGLAALLFASCVSPGTNSVSEWAGSWFAPSLSRADTPIEIRILKDGTAIEQIGDYRGRGTWRVAGNTARIDWDTHWIGILRPAPGGRMELATWKPGSPPDGPPDDVQPATRGGKLP